MKFVICGPSACGKNYLLKQLIKIKFKYSPKITTRPMRDKEEDGVDYFFTSNEDFVNLINNESIKIYQKFLINNQEWYYGISEENFEKNTIFILTPYEIALLSTDRRAQMYIIYMDIDIDIRRKRLYKRNDPNDSIERRLASDLIDFENFTDYDLHITDVDYKINIHELLNLL